MQFQQRSDVLVNWTATTWGAQIQVPIPREFFLEGLIIQFKVTSTATATPSFLGDFLAGIADVIRLDVPTGSTLRSPVNASSSALLQYWRFTNGGLDRQTLAACDVVSQTTAAWQQAGREAYINVPIMFTPPNLDDPAASFFLLPLPRYSANPTLTIQVASTGAAPAPFATANAPTLQYKIIMLRRFVDVPDFPVFDTEFNFVRMSFPNAGDNQYNEIPSPGVFTGLMFQTYKADGKSTLPIIDQSVWSNGTLNALTGFTQFNKYVELKFLGNTIRRANPLDIQVIGDWSTDVGVNPLAIANSDVGALGGNNFMWDFLSDRTGANAGDFGSALDTNPLVGQGSRVQLYMSPTYGTGGGSVVNMYYNRVFGDVSPLMRKMRPVKKR